jgi:hypothetical protein
MIDEAGLLHSVQRALVGNIGPHVAGVAVHPDDHTVTVEAFVTEGLTDEERAGLEDALTDVIADLPAGGAGRLVVSLVSGTHLVSDGQWAHVLLGYTVSQPADKSLPPVKGEQHC